MVEKRVCEAIYRAAILVTGMIKKTTYAMAVTAIAADSDESTTQF
jgi:hypothetical protein